MKTLFNGRQIEITDINYGKHDPVDSFIESAYYLDTEEELTEEELIKLTDETDFYQDWYEHKICEAEYYYGND